MLTRLLGRSGIQVSALGMGCWAIGGPFTRVDSSTPRPLGWGQVDDKESIRAIHRALDMGVNFFDTADAYGCGHSERVLGRAVARRRDQVVIATKFGGVFDEGAKTWLGDADEATLTPEFIREACEASLRRLNTDVIDLYQFHINDFDPGKAVAVRETLEDLVAEGKIRCYGWSTNHADRARVFAEGEHCVAIQHELNVLTDASDMLEVCEEFDMASINRSPLLMGILTGKFTASSTFPDDDVRQDQAFRDKGLVPTMKRLAALRFALTGGGRTMAQGALAWIWARSERTIPIPGFKTVTQVEENARAMAFGPLDEEQMRRIDELLEH